MPGSTCCGTKQGTTVNAGMGGGKGGGGGAGAGINLLWHHAGHYGETQRGEGGSVEEFKILIQTPHISYRTETFIAVFIFDRACGFQTLHLRLESSDLGSRT